VAGGLHLGAFGRNSGPRGIEGTAVSLQALLDHSAGKQRVRVSRLQGSLPVPARVGRTPRQHINTCNGVPSRSKSKEDALDTFRHADSWLPLTEMAGYAAPGCEENTSVPLPASRRIIADSEQGLTAQKLHMIIFSTGHRHCCELVRQRGEVLHNAPAVVYWTSATVATPLAAPFA